jgi:peptidoglycan/LPS O-acetylase OafA/YrhL
MMSVTQKSPSRLPALDGLRAIAVATVVLYHAGFSSVPGDLGVQLFFVLSGFLITRLLIDEFASTGSVNYWAFVERRAFRILPAYYVFLAGSFVLDHLLGTSWSRGMTTSALAYLYNYWSAAHDSPHTVLSHTWSLAVEEHFYVLWPVAFLFLARRGRRALAGGCAVVVVTVMLWRCFLWWKTADSALVYNRSDTRIDSILLGCLLSCLYATAAFPRTLPLWRLAWMPIATGTALVLVRTSLPVAFHYSVGFTVEALLCAVIIVQMLQLSQTPVWRWIDSPFARWIGTLSYSIYLWHQWGVAIGASLLPAPGARLIAGLLATIGLAASSYYVVERPALALRARRSARRAASADPEHRSGSSE